ncbi:hypothetical protein JRG19_01245 [Pseudoclavibacter alba]|uniref:hypothetical protein n=1 Tax=Pseudoclavibacter albus TaxID=272241 RepID=UPI0019D01AAA|nr:hypothetical protein [Pseudoclavibacter alba]MBN6777175.1 hypothetical protein [Pseudoclavibacter alba]
MTGAKFTPRNHRATRHPVLDATASGVLIKHHTEDVLDEAKRLSDTGCRYWHFHARNPMTNEQTTSNSIYQAARRGVQAYDPSMIMSFGASRNGAEVKHSIQHFGEWERISQVSLPLHLGGAHFVTTQAAVELQVILDLEQQVGPLPRSYVDSQDFSNDISCYTPSPRARNASLDTFSIANGSNYGSTSPEVQFKILSRAIQERNRLHLPHEVEWVQLGRSYAATRFSVEHPEIRLGNSGQISITLLFGFSPLFPFPHRYEDFVDVVSLAESLEFDPAGRRCRNVTVVVGAAVIAQHALQRCVPMDVGPDRGKVVSPLKRLVHYACLTVHQVDILRIGMEDTPYRCSDSHDAIELTTNIQLAGAALAEMRKIRVTSVTNTVAVSERMKFDALDAHHEIEMTRLSLTLEQRSESVGAAA